jgi:hypothetical protein
MPDPKPPRMDEKDRIEKYEKERKPFLWTNTPDSIKFVQKIRLKSVRFDLDKRKLAKLRCYLYHIDRLGISEHNFEEEFEGKTLLIYSNTYPKFRTRTKCPWCFGPTEDFLKHIKEAHNKTEDNVVRFSFQQKLYRELLRIVRETPYHFATMFLNKGCEYCDNPVMKGRELCCSIPTSFRDRARSLTMLGMSASNLKEEYVTDPNMGQILLAP